MTPHNCFFTSFLINRSSLQNVPRDLVTILLPRFRVSFMQSGASNIRQNQSSTKERFPTINAKIIENINRNLGKQDPIVFNLVPSLISDTFLYCTYFYCKIIIICLRVWTLLSQLWIFFTDVHSAGYLN